MKKITFIFLLMPLFCLSQAPKKTNQIIVTTSDSEDEAYKKIGRILLSDGFILETLNKDFYMLATNAKTCNYGMMGAGKIDVKINAQIDKKDDKSVITITGKVISPDFGNYKINEFDLKAMTIENIGGKSSISGASWLIMDGIANKYDGGTITYQIK